MRWPIRKPAPTRITLLENDALHERVIGPRASRFNVASVPGDSARYCRDRTVG